MKKKLAALAGLAALAVLQSAVAWNARLYWKGKSAANPPDRIRLLGRANAAYPWNELVHFELGRAYFERAAEALGDPASRDADLAAAVQWFLRSLRLNPASPAGHFHLAQALLYAAYLGQPAPFAYFEEYKKAAALAGHNTQIYLEVGLVLLSRWEALSDEEREFTVGILKPVAAGGDEERFLRLLETWNLHGSDYAVIDRLLPDDAATLRAYARFLAEKGLSQKARWTALARAEQADFLRAKSELDLGRREGESFRPAEAAGHLEAALDALGTVKFYQNLAGLELVDPREFAAVRLGARRLLAMARVEESRSLADEDGAVAAYLALEGQFSAFGEFEGFLRERGLLGEGPAASEAVKDLRTLAFRMSLDFALNRYRDIVRVGDLLASSALVITPAGKPSYARILGLIAASYLKLDYVYEAERHFRRALEVEPASLENLLGLESCYDRLNDEAGAAAARRAIDRLLTPPAVALGGRILREGETSEMTLVTDGRPLAIRLELSSAEPTTPSLVAVFFDGRVVWEGAAGDSRAAFPATPRPGPARLEITAVNGALRLDALTLGPGEGRSPAAAR